MAALLAIGLGMINVPALLRLIRHGERTSATIVQYPCSTRKGRAAYTFTVGTTRYSGTDVTTTVDCHHLTPGDTIQIYYDVTDPTVSRAGEPRERLANELIFIALACFFAPPIIIGGNRLRSYAFQSARDRREH
jgi:hypothetical protein